MFVVVSSAIVHSSLSLPDTTVETLRHVVSGFRGREDRDDRDGGRAEQGPSRADESDNWGASRKFTPSDGPRSGGFGGGGFGGGRDRDGGRDREGGGEDRPPRREFVPSAADETDDWGAGRKFQPASDADSRGGGAGGGGGFGGYRDGGRDREGGYREREGGFRDRPRGGFDDRSSRADTEEWGGRRAAPDAASSRNPRGYGFSSDPSSAADSDDKWVRRGPPSEPSSDTAPAAPAERPRLNLAPRTKPVEAPEPAAAAPAEAAPAASAPSSENGDSQPAEKPKRSNPFGAARPREEVLKEKGIDYVKEELKLEHGEVIRCVMTSVMHQVPA